MQRNVGALARAVAAVGAAWLLSEPAGDRWRADASAPTLLPGTWEVVSARRDGAPDHEAVGGLLRFEGDRVTFEAKAPPQLTIESMALS